MGKYPIYLELGGRRVIVIGGGSVAVRKVQVLMDAGARVVVISKDLDNALTELCARSDIELIKSKYSKDYLAGAVIVIAATNNPLLNEQIFKDCQKLQILCNVVDQPQLCDFFVPAVVKRGDLQIAIGTNGKSPAYAGHLRKKLEQVFTDKHGEFLAELDKMRNRVIKEVSNTADRKTILGQLADDESFEYFTQNGPDQWRRYADEITTGFIKQA